MKRSLLVIPALLITRTICACTTFSVPPIAVDSTVVAFSGVVLDYSTSTRGVLGHPSVPGLKVRVSDAIAGSTAQSIMTVYLFRSAPDCSPSPRSLNELEAQYPVGSNVTVVTSGPQSLSDASSPSVVSNADDWGHVSRVPQSQPRTSEGLLDFTAFAGEYEHQPKQSFSLPLAWRNAHRSWFEDFEYVRALVLLEHLKSSSRQVAILGTLKSYSRWGHMSSEWAQDTYRALVKRFALPALQEQALLSSVVTPKKSQ